mmetsp:Transcript_933/g.840  ORF Transcript_933/g.840 Transcript_933/m.840 type:complete len:135 (-) Transcript_933:446-850(-)
MDIFSLGCVIAEILLDGKTLFTYEELLAYRRNEYDPLPIVDKIEDDDIKAIVKDMIKKNPSERADIFDVLKRWGSICPDSFSSIIYYINASLSSFNFVTPDQRIALIQQLLDPIYEEIIKEPKVPHYETLPIPI